MSSRSRLISLAQQTCKFFDNYIFPHYIRKHQIRSSIYCPCADYQLLRRGLRFCQSRQNDYLLCVSLHSKCDIHKVIEPCASTDIVRLCSLLLRDLYDLQYAMFPQLRSSIFQVIHLSQKFAFLLQTTMGFNLLLVN